jgi:hypothetical protein
LLKLGFVLEENFGKEVSKHGIAFSDVNQPVIKALKHFWAEQGDYLSI